MMFLIMVAEAAAKAELLRTNGDLANAQSVVEWWMGSSGHNITVCNINEYQ